MPAPTEFIARKADAQIINDVEVTIEYANESDAAVSDAEIGEYLARAKQRYPHGHLSWLKLEVDGEDVGIHYGLDPVPFDRIRRITGYLVGTMDRWNDAKTSEENDRVKHAVQRNAAQCGCVSC